MTTHLSDDALLELAETGEFHPHITQCDRCRRLVEEGRDTLALVRGDHVPEPSPLFWDHLSARVRDAVASDAARGALAPKRPFPRLGWRHVAAGALALGLVLAFAWRAQAPRRGEGVTASFTPAARPEAATVSRPPDAVPAEGEAWEESTDASWRLVTDATSGADLDTAVQAEGFALQLGAAERAALQLTPDEQRELVRLLQAAIESPE